LWRRMSKSLIVSVVGSVRISTSYQSIVAVLVEVLRLHNLLNWRERGEGGLWETDEYQPTHSNKG